jgi:hypothetical protein
VNPGFDYPDPMLLEAEIWDVLDQIPGTDCRETSELIYRYARRSEGIIVLVRPSARTAASAALGALASGSRLGPVRVYLVDASLELLLGLYAELSRVDLACDVTLYHGALSEFFRDLPLSADLICTPSSGLEFSDGLELSGTFQASLSSGSVILGLAETAEAGRTAARHLIDAGVLEPAEVRPGSAIYRATRQCRRPRFVPRTGLRVELQDRLHERYFLSESGRHADQTPVADLMEDVRREFTRSFPAASGLGPWPYVAPESSDLPLTLPSGKPWPKVSIVTPTRNQGRYLEETILSVLHQDYPNVEYIIVDGASTDESPSILERYRDRLALVISEPDNGQSHAINKGLSKATGEILTWLNGDDMLAPGALAAVALAFDLNSADMIAGICRLYRDGSLESQHLTSCADGPLSLAELLDLDQGWNAGQFFIQPEVMFTRDIWLRAGARVNEQLNYTMDYELWLRFARAGARLHAIGRSVAWFRLHEEQKISARSSVALELTSCRDAFARESDIQFKAARPVFSSRRQKLRIAMLIDDGSSSGSAPVRVARALAWAGHEISIVEVPEASTPKGPWGDLLDRVSATHADLVMLCDLNYVNVDSRLSSVLSKRFPTIVIAGNTWASTPSVESIRPGFPLDVFRPRNKQACREDLGLPMDRFLILLASAGDESGNESSLLFDALERLELPNVAVVSTDPTTKRGLLEVIQLSRIDDPRRTALLNSAVDIVVAATAGTQDQVYMEATACGTPIAAYPLAPPREALRHGVTGLLASDDKPASLAAAIHYLYIHPEFRNDLSVWGRLYVENEWSEFSAYRRMFLALQRLGFSKSLQLGRRIEFAAQARDTP